MQIKFGTDGWRARIADDYTFDNVRRVAQGFARYMQQEGLAEKGVAIGHDRRFQAEHFAAATAEVLAGNGIQVWLTDGATPTPAISFSVVDKGAGGGINITASHNPATDCGFKVRDPLGGALPPQALKKVEAVIPDDMAEVQRVKLADGVSDGRIQLFDAAPAYTQRLLSLVDVQPIKDAGFKVLVDPMWGNGAGWFEKLIGGGKTTIHEVHSERNPVFPHMTRPEPIPPNVDHGLSFVQQVGADVAIINDGDADRLGVGDEYGRFIDQLRVYGLLGYYFLELRGERGPIVKTISTTKMLNKLGKLYGVPVHETGVGFKYIAPKMVEVDAMIGGEESGGYAFRQHVPERDGLLAGLFVLDMMVRTGKRPSQLLETLFEKVGAHFYDRIDSTFDAARKAEILANVASARPATVGGLKVTDIVTVDGHQFIMEDGGWLLVRFSGTEPIIRVYCETTHEDRVQDILQDGMKIAGLVNSNQ
ncbi:MAG: phosphoglucomutase/phosphomannomutase family protein [Ardenticatenaceae bacterium]|nr:phosphoglucomutase/phosphomannomutase family protein [Anaerolineales bacterium]MCB8921858.1 phosphoglucomutase/phosphomannomutase family protein [Ardenticatenaceae bacterium]MCB8990984.1 phosphoglucomutase/phosphomannomutase family protein [Ardenticatenaceae bacterium]MCB9005336.1 phosphoglucomutase/phosphomannomutase family protein [Ardenticatenaceae bacterium]